MSSTAVVPKKEKKAAAKLTWEQSMVFDARVDEVKFVPWQPTQEKLDPEFTAAAVAAATTASAAVAAAAAHPPQN